MNEAASGIVRVRREDLGILLVDVQPQFVNAMAGDSQAMVDRIAGLVMMAERLSVPVLATVEEPVARKGGVIATIADAVPSENILSKQSYDATREPGIHGRLRTLERKQLAVAGSETDVCVLQTTLGLLEQGFETFLLLDCVFSSAENTDAAVQRMISAGAVPVTLKSLYFELIKTDACDEWNHPFA